MSWRERGRSSATADEDGRPLVEAVLEHYGVDMKYRAKQMVQCPLHEDNHPSLSVNTSRQLWKCHSCGQGGDAWELIKIMEGKDFAGAVAFAATVGLTDGSTGERDSELPGNVVGRSGRGSVSHPKGDRGTSGAYVPTWRRR